MFYCYNNFENSVVKVCDNKLRTRAAHKQHIATFRTSEQKTATFNN